MSPDGCLRTYGPHPDAVLLHQWRTRRKRVAETMERVMAAPIEPPKRKKIENSKPKAKPTETKVCARCGRERNRLEWFPRGSKYCYPCRPRKLEVHAKWKEKRRRLAGIKARYAQQMAILRGEA